MTNTKIIVAIIAIVLSIIGESLIIIFGISQIQDSMKVCSDDEHQVNSIELRLNSNITSSVILIATDCDFDESVLGFNYTGTFSSISGVVNVTASLEGNYLVDCNQRITCPNFGEITDCTLSLFSNLKLLSNISEAISHFNCNNSNLSYNAFSVISPEDTFENTKLNFRNFLYRHDNVINDLTYDMFLTKLTNEYNSISNIKFEKESTKCKDCKETAESNLSQGFLALISGSIIVFAILIQLILYVIGMKNKSSLSENTHELHVL
jgi:hypothetical protein